MEMAINGTGEAARNFAKALGLDPTKTRKIVLTVEANEIMLVEVEYMPNESDIAMLGLELQRFNLIAEKDD